MKITWFAVILSVVSFCGSIRLKAAEEPGAIATSAAEAAESVTPSADEATIRANADKYVEAYNRRDSQTMVSMWSPEAVYMDPATGEGVVGRDAIKRQFDDAFAGAGDAKLAVNVESVEFVSPNVAIEKGSAHVTYSDSAPEDSTYSAVLMKRDGQWMIDRVTESETPEPPPSNYEHLKELEWMVGSWVDQDANATIQTDCEWTKNKNFLTRSFAVEIGGQVPMAGMQIVGWDPAAKQIRSWVFDSTGGFSGGTWTRKGDSWYVQQTGTLSDGGKSTAVNVFTYVDDNSFKWQSTNREVDGQILPNIDEVLIVRKTD